MTTALPATRDLVRRLLFLLPVLLFAGVAAYFLAGLSGERNPREVPSAMIGQPVPDFDLPSMRAGAAGLTRADLLAAGETGKVAVVNFFASWCLACRLEHPLLLDLAKRPNVALYGILYKDEPAAAENWLQEMGGDPYRAIGVDPQGRTAIDFGVTGVPETFVIDREGRIRYRRWGPLDQATLDETVLPLLDQLAKQ